MLLFPSGYFNVRNISLDFNDFRINSKAISKAPGNQRCHGRRCSSWPCWGHPVVTSSPQNPTAKSFCRFTNHIGFEIPIDSKSPDSTKSPMWSSNPIANLLGSQILIMFTRGNPCWVRLPPGKRGTRRGAHFLRSKMTS